MASNPHYDHGLLWRAIAISLLLHVVLLLQPGLGSMSSRLAAGPSLVALLRPKAEAPLQAADRAAQASRMAHAPAALREANSAASPVTAPTLPEPPTMADIAGAAIGNASTADKTNVTASVSGAKAGDSDAGLDFAEGKKSYLFAIAAEARRVKKYPPRALAAGWTGTAEIRVLVAAGGNVQTPQLHKSSGHADIDNAALSFVGMALKRTPVPESLHERNFDFVLPVSFTINNE